MKIRQGNVKVMIGKKGGVARQEKEGVGIGKNEQRHEKMTKSGIKGEGIPTCLEWAWEIRNEMGEEDRGIGGQDRGPYLD
ncbi:MAG: hypothetical protein DCC43_07710 [Candidatus Brocadia sp.]|nr:hypothetical protein [Anaerolineales bacterium]MCC6324485.1 hypothetical protein [Candidatus Brocadia sp.]MCE7911094.1 hypothetical protein [Candidatus Brocadia sp. AMX3]MDG5997316.1 hypothetical protein [Candidatus Brocadia sp.]RIJ99844.1 MAG: hypothetical protein DCC43_07710 [Candidatus Brocadia sp.]